MRLRGAFCVSKHSDNLFLFAFSRSLSATAFCLGMILTTIVFLMENSSYILNLMVQTTGYHFQYSIFQLPFHTDAFGQLREGEGRAVDDGAAAVWWYDAWTIFYVSF